MKTRMLAVAICGLMVQACSSLDKGGTRFADPSAIAVLEPTQGSTVRGAVDFVRKGQGVQVTANLSGLVPNATHGIRIHESGDCTSRDGSSAGGLFNPNPSSTAPAGTSGAGGDLGNLTADANGNIAATVTMGGDIAFGNGTDSIVGRGLVVHAIENAQQGGNSEARLSCGLITRNPDRTTQQG